MAGEENRIVRLLSYAMCESFGNELNSKDSESILPECLVVCQKLMERDFRCEVLNNQDGQLCSTYPNKLFIPVSKTDKRHASKLHELVYRCRFARTRTRFTVPVLLVRDKYVCRSSTLARSPEIYCRTGYGYLMQGENYETDFEIPDNDLNGSSATNLSVSQYSPINGSDPETSPAKIHSTSNSNPDLLNGAINDNNKNKEWLLDKMRNADINLLHFLEVDTIFDLMVEKKKVKFGMNVTSSEKVDRQQRYLKFNLLSVPYPGCEFFAEYKKSNYRGEGLKFDWKQNFVDADLSLPAHIKDSPEIDWQDYVTWDLIELTQNYLKLMLRSLVSKNSNGLLLHCISGWDRTPLFISLIRLSLWADGLVHQSLNAEEMIYFTVAYDWLLFSHQFSDRMAKDEEIFFFCFDFLRYIESDEYSMSSHFSKSIENGDGRSSPHIIQETSVVLNGESLNIANSENGEGSGHKVEKNGGTNEVTDGAKSNPAVMDINEICCWNRDKMTNEKEYSESGYAQNGKTNKNDHSGGITESIPIIDLQGNGVSHLNEHSTKYTSTSNVELSAGFDNRSNGVNDNQEDVDESEFEKIDRTPPICDEESSTRRSKLRKAREILKPAYEIAVQQFRDQERQQATGFSGLLSQIKKHLI